MSGIIGTAEIKAPQTIQVYMEAFREGGITKNLEKVLAKDVKMSAVGFIHGNLAGYEDSTPAKVAALFKKIIFPEGIRVTGGMSWCEPSEGGKWTVTVNMNSTLNNENKRTQITSVCTLVNGLISYIEAEVEPC